MVFQCEVPQPEVDQACEERETALGRALEGRDGNAWLYPCPTILLGLAACSVGRLWPSCHKQPLINIKFGYLWNLSCCSIFKQSFRKQWMTKISSYLWHWVAQVVNVLATCVHLLHYQRHCLSNCVVVLDIYTVQLNNYVIEKCDMLYLDLIVYQHG